MDLVEDKKGSAQREEEKALLFDSQLFGLLLRRERMNQGIKTADAFSVSIEKKTGFKISRDLLYRIESGKTLPNLEQAIAISLSLRDNTSPGLFEGIASSIDMATCKQWHAKAKVVYRNEDIPF